jgi:hypothetical protein
MMGITLLVLALHPAAHADNLVKNADFSDVDAQGVPTGWKAYGNKQKLSADTKEITGDAKQSLRIDIVADGGKSLGQIVQKISVTPNTRYLFKLDMKSTASGVALGQIKLLVGSSEIERIATDKSLTEWKTVEKEFDTGEANMVWVVLRYFQREGNIGQNVWFANPSLTEAPSPATP